MQPHPLPTLSRDMDELETGQLFDADAARVSRDEAIERVDQHAEERWLRTAKDALREVAKIRAEFTTDAVWGWLQKYHPELPPPHEPRAMGAVMRWACESAHLIVKTDRTAPSVRERCHARDLTVWHSLIHADPESLF